MEKPNKAQPRIFQSGVRIYVYTVQEGETLADILRKHGSSARALAARNAHRDLFHLQPGERLRVPRAAVAPGARTYRVRRGENVYTLASKFGRSVTALLKANPSLRPDEICRGVYIRLPEI